MKDARIIVGDVRVELDALDADVARRRIEQDAPLLNSVEVVATTRAS